MSRTQYGNLLEGLFRRADLTPLNGLKIIQSEPDNKSVPMLAPKKPAYTKLTYDVTVKGDLYHLVDFLQHFYHQPLLHQVKKMNIQRPSDRASQRGRELDINLTIEALVLDNAQPRPTLLPVLRELALLSGAAAQTGYNMHATSSGRGSPVPPSEVLADGREYLAIPGKNFFFGPLPTPKERDKRDDDHSPFVTLTSIVQDHSTGEIKAVFRDKLDNHNYTITQKADGSIGVIGEYELNGRWRTVKDYSREKPGRELFFGSDEAQNKRVWRVRRVTANEVILEKVDAVDNLEKAKPPALAFVGGGAGVVVSVPEGKMYRVGVGQNLQTEGWDEKLSVTAATKFLLSREAWKAVYEPAPATSALSPEDRAEK